MIGVYKMSQKRAKRNKMYVEVFNMLLNAGVLECKRNEKREGTGKYVSRSCL